jgi:hypothetical protein
VLSKNNFFFLYPLESEQKNILFWVLFTICVATKLVCDILVFLSSVENSQQNCHFLAWIGLSIRLHQKKEKSPKIPINTRKRNHDFLTWERIIIGSISFWGEKTDDIPFRFFPFVCRLEDSLSNWKIFYIPFLQKKTTFFFFSTREQRLVESEKNIFFSFLLLGERKRRNRKKNAKMAKEKRPIFIFVEGVWRNRQHIIFALRVYLDAK